VYSIVLLLVPTTGADVIAWGRHGGGRGCCSPCYSYCCYPVCCWYYYPCCYRPVYYGPCVPTSEQTQDKVALTGEEQKWLEELKALADTEDQKGAVEDHFNGLSHDEREAYYNEHKSSDNALTSLEQQWLDQLKELADTADKKAAVESHFKQLSHDEREAYYKEHKTGGSDALTEDEQKWLEELKGQTDKPEKKTKVEEYFKGMSHKERQQYYKQHKTGGGGASKGGSSTRGTVVVRMPSDAKLYLDGQLAPLTSEIRVFDTPPLTKAKDYYYTITSVTDRDGEPITASRRVMVRAGKVSHVDFSPAPAHVRVRLPNDATLQVDGRKCPVTSGRRSFDTPKLEQGREYFYTFKAQVVREGRAQSESRRVMLEAGKDVTVDFGDLTSVQITER
jgi:uncharacterized protein (TIGR03000 family)